MEKYAYLYNKLAKDMARFGASDMSMTFRTPESASHLPSVLLALAAIAIIFWAARRI